MLVPVLVLVIYGGVLEEVGEVGVKVAVVEVVEVVEAVPVTAGA